MTDTLQLRREAHWMEGRILMAMIDCPADDDARYARLQHARYRAERRYWRRYERDNPPGNRTPDWMIKTSKGGY